VTSKTAVFRGKLSCRERAEDSLGTSRVRTVACIVPRGVCSFQCERRFPMRGLAGDRPHSPETGFGEIDVRYVLVDSLRRLCLVPRAR
jgi:hypothetical protein